MFLTAPRPPAAVPLTRLVGKLPLGRLSQPIDGRRLLLAYGCFSGRSQDVPVMLNHHRQLTRGTIRGTEDSLLLDVCLDPTRRDHREVLDSLARGDRWGISPRFVFAYDMRRRRGGEPIQECFLVDSVSEVTVTQRPCFDCSSLKVEN